MIKSKRLGRFEGLDFIFTGIVVTFALMCFTPFLYTFTYSITPYSEYLKNPANLLPRNVNLDAYREVLGFQLIKTGFLNSTFIVLVGSILQVLILVMTAYPLTKKDLKGVRTVLILYTFTMFFNGGIIPEYFVMRGLKLINTRWALIFTAMNGAYSIILMKNFLSSIPDAISEAATIDGANDIQTLFRIILPLSIPAIATMFLLYAVFAWNDFFRAIIYITKREMWPLQLVLREMILEGNIGEMSMIGEERNVVFPFNLKMATVMVSIIPILLLYPFLQKYFVTGLTLGAVKG